MVYGGVRSCRSASTVAGATVNEGAGWGDGMGCGWWKKGDAVAVHAAVSANCGTGVARRGGEEATVVVVTVGTDGVD